LSPPGMECAISLDRFILRTGELSAGPEAGI
jgi:hypothetical protein